MTKKSPITIALIALAFAALGCDSLGIFDSLPTPEPYDCQLPQSTPAPSNAGSVGQQINVSVPLTSVPNPSSPIIDTQAAHVVQLNRWGTGTAEDVFWSPSGKIAVVKAFAQLLFYDVSSFTLLRTIEINNWETDLGFTSGGDYQYIDGSGSVWQWEASTNTIGKLSDGNSVYQSAKAVSPDKKLIAKINNKDYTIELWDAATGERQQTLKGHTDLVLAFEFSPDGQELASGSYDGSIKLWDVQTGSLVDSFQTSRHTEYISYSLDGQFLAADDYDAFSSNTSISYWQLGAATPRFRWKGPGGAVKIDPSGKRLATADESHAVLLLDLSDCHILQRFAGHTKNIIALSFSPDGQSLASVGHDNTVRFWNTRPGTAIATLSGFSSDIHGLALNPDGKSLAYAEWSTGVIGILPLSGGQVVTPFDFTKIDHVFENLAYSPDGKKLAVGDDSGNANILDITSGNLDYSFGDNGYIVRNAAFSPDGSTLAVSSKVIKLWNTSNGSLLKSCVGHTGIVNDVAYGPDNWLLASASEDGTARLWVVPDCILRDTLDAGIGAVTAVSIDPTGALLASGYRSGEIYLWDIKTGKQLLAFAGHEGGVTDLLFNPGGKVLVSGGDNLDATLKLWRIPDGKLLNTLSGHAWSVSQVALNRDATLLVSGGRDGTLRFWGIAP